MNTIRRWNRWLCGAALLLLINSVSFAQEGTRTTVEMIGNSACSIMQTYVDFDIVQQVDQYTAYYGWKEYAPYGEERVSKRTNKSETDPSAGFLAIPANRTASIRMGSKRYEDSDQQYQTAQGARMCYQYQVTADNAIALFDYATMLEYPSHEILDQEAWAYSQPWVQFYVSVFDNNQDNIQSPTVVLHAYKVPAGTLGWQQCTVATGWSQLNNVPLVDATTGGVARNMTILKKDWSTVGLDLRACIGYTVRIWVEYYDCAMKGWQQVYNPDVQGGYDTYPDFCPEHHISRIYSSLACTQAVLQKEGETCDPATVTYSAPEGFSYRWYTSSNPGVTLSTSQTCTYTFNNGSEQTDLVCELKSSTNMGATTLSVPIQNKCACQSTFTFPEYVCADAQNIEIAYEYTSGSARSYDVTFNDEALARGFNNLTDQPIQYTNRIYIPMPAATGTQYVRPNQYLMTLRVHQSNGVDTVMTQTIEVRYPSWLVDQRWNDVLAVFNQNYNGGYYFSTVQWYQDDVPVYSSAPYQTYLYQPQGLNTASQYYAALTRMDDGKTFCTCSMTPSGDASAPERKDMPITLQAYGGNSRIVQVTTDLSGKYTIYHVDGRAVQTGVFGTLYGSPSIVLPNAGTFVIRFRSQDGEEDTKKWVAY